MGFIKHKFLIYWDAYLSMCYCKITLILMSTGETKRLAVGQQPSRLATLASNHRLSPLCEFDSHMWLYLRTKSMRPWLLNGM